jgi:hypothetical protein
MPEDVPSTVLTDVNGVLGAIADLLIQRVRKNRRQRRGLVTVPNVPATFAEVFDYWVKEDLWREVKRPGSNAPTYWSFKPEAADRLCRFEEVFNEVTSTGARGRFGRREAPRCSEAPLCFRKAGGSSMVGSNGDVCSVLPPLYASLDKHKVGDTGKVWRYSLRLWFSVGVVSGAGAVDPDDCSDLNEEEAANLLLHANFPGIREANFWPQLPPYADPAAHFLRHIQRTVINHLLDPGSIAVMELKAMDLSKPDLAPSCEDFLRRGGSSRAIRGFMWDEARAAWIATRTKADKEKMWSKNCNVHRRRRAESELEVSAYMKRQRGEPVSESELTDEEGVEPVMETIQLSPGELRWLERGY